MFDQLQQKAKSSAHQLKSYVVKNPLKSSLMAASIIGVPILAIQNAKGFTDQSTQNLALGVSRGLQNIAGLKPKDIKGQHESLGTSGIRVASSLYDIRYKQQYGNIKNYQGYTNM